MNISREIEKIVMNSKLKLQSKQLKIKELFIRSLNEGISPEEFRREMRNILSPAMLNYMDDDIEYLERIIQAKDESALKDTGIVLTTAGIVSYFALTPNKKFRDTITTYESRISKQYNQSTNTIQNSVDKQAYLKNLVKKYNDRTVPYYYTNKATGEVTKIVYQTASTYLSMLHNTNLTRACWNTTLSDGKEGGIDQYIIPYHLYTCPICVPYQNKILSGEELREFTDIKITHDTTDLLHPNCKCVPSLYTDPTQISKENHASKSDVYYQDRQKANNLTLKKERVKTDYNLQKYLGNQDEMDKLQNQLNRINDKLSDLRNSVPSEYKNSLTAINR